MFRTLLLTTLPVIAAFTFACGGGDDDTSEAGDTTAPATATIELTTNPTATVTPEPTPTPLSSRRETPERQLLISAISNTADLQSYRFESTISISRLAALPVNVSSVSFAVSGAADPANNRLEMLFDFSELIAALAKSAGDAEAAVLLEDIFGTEPLQFRYIDGIAYISGWMVTALLDIPTNWVSFPAELDQSVQSIGSLGLGQFSGQDEILALLSDVYGVETVGQEAVRGVDTTHYRGVIGLATLLAQSNPDEAAQIESSLGIQLDEHLGDVPLDVWIDEDGIIRRVLLVTDFSDFGGVGRYAEETVGAITLSHDIYDVGENIVIEYPPSEDITPVDDTFLESAAALGSEAPSSESPSSGAPSSEAPSSEAPSS